jgi:hypothetical protein
MKHLIIILFTLLTLGSTTSPDDNTYTVTLSTITVSVSMLEGFVPERAKTWNEDEFVKLNKPLINYLAKHTWMNRQQIFAMLRMEQGKGSYLLTKHNNPFNITASKGITAQTWEYTLDNVVNGVFASYNTLQEGLNATIALVNGKYYHEPTTNVEALKHIYEKGWHTDPNWRGRVKLANKYKKYEKIQTSIN